MNVWIFNAYGPIPGENWRPTRCMMMARTFAEQGHDAVWWTAGFSHLAKRHRCHDLTDIQEQPGCTVRLVPTSGYQRHIGLGRLWSEAIFAKRCFEHARSLPSPDVIVAGHASQTLGYAAVRLAAELRVPLILDVIDLWPEAFSSVFPTLLRPVADFVLSPLFALRRWIFSNASGITAVCQEYLDVHLRFQPEAKSAVVYWAADIESIRRSERNAAVRLGPGLAMTKSGAEVWAIYAGTFGVNYDLDTLLTAAASLKTLVPELRILIAGSGPRRDHLLFRIKHERLTNVMFLDAKSADEISALYRICDLAIMGYVPGSTVSFPIKFFDYTAAGLPILSSVGGELSNLLRDRSMGVQYEGGNAQSLAKELAALAKDSELRSKMAQQAFAAAAVFDRAAQYGRFVNLASNLCGQSAYNFPLAPISQPDR